MSSTTKTIIFAAVLLAVACAGILVAEDADAEGQVTVTYSLPGGASIPVQTAEDGTIVLYGPEDVSAFYQPDGGEFVAWQTQEDGGTIYQFGATVAFSENTTLYPRIVAATTVDFIVDGQVMKEGALAPVEGKVTAPAVPAKDGFNALGWEWSEDDSGKVYTSAEVSELTVEAGQTFTAVYSEIYDIDWIVDGVTIATGSTETGKELSQPADPSKANHEFAGWAVDGEVVLKAGEKLTAEDIAADTTFTATFNPVMLTVTFMAGESTVATVSVPYGQTVVMPALPEGYASWDFDFKTPITESITVKAVASAVEPSETFTVTFVVDGKTIATYSSNAITVPTDPVKEGFAFQGWAIGDSVIADPAKHVYTQDTVLVALFQAVEVVEHTVTFTGGAEDITVKVVHGEGVEAPEAPEGMQWDPAVDLDEITADTVVKAVPLTVTVTFMVGETAVKSLEQTVVYGGKLDASLFEGYVLPDGYIGWDVDVVTATFTADTVVNAVAEPAPVEEPDFLDTTGGQVAMVLLAFVVIALIGMIVTNQFGMKDRLKSLVRRSGKE